MKRISILAAAAAFTATSALGAWSAQAAGTDGSGSGTHVSSRPGESEPGDDHGHQGSGHTRQGESEPGDDHGHHGESEPGDDDGHHGESEPGDDHGGHHHDGDDD